jgi:hypothetical protein
MRSNLIQIGTIWLTEDGTNTGRRYKTRIPNLARLIPVKIGQKIVAIDGTPHMNSIRPNTKNIVLGIELLVDIDKARFDQIVTAINTALNTNSSMALNISGHTGNFALTAKPSIPDAIAFPSEFSGDTGSEHIKGTVFTFYTV